MSVSLVSLLVRLCQRVVWNLNNPCWLTLSETSMYESTLLCSPMLNESITYTQECLTFSLFVFLYRYKSIFSDLMFPIGKQLLKQLHFLVDVTRDKKEGKGQRSKKVSLREEKCESSKRPASLWPPFELIEYQSKEWQPSFLTGACEYGKNLSDLLLEMPRWTKKRAGSKKYEKLFCESTRPVAIDLIYLNLLPFHFTLLPLLLITITTAV